MLLRVCGEDMCQRATFPGGHQGIPLLLGPLLPFFLASHSPRGLSWGPLTPGLPRELVRQLFWVLGASQQPPRVWSSEEWGPRSGRIAAPSCRGDWSGREVGQSWCRPVVLWTHGHGDTRAAAVLGNGTLRGPLLRVPWFWGPGRAGTWHMPHTSVE